MKILCDVCGKEEALLFCCADEAALCGPCDHRVHRANKLAGKHRRFSLIRPSAPSHAPLCDVCQEKRAFLFCQEDRAILCRDCDGPIHSSNEHTRKHNRFLLTGVKLSSAATPAVVEAESSDAAGGVSSSSEREELDTGAATKKKKVGTDPKPALPVQNQSNSTGISTSTSEKVVVLEEESGVCGVSAVGGSSISDYLMKTLPGWHVEDLLLDIPSPAPSSFASITPAHGLCKMGITDDVLPFLEADLDAAAAASVNDAPLWWVPQVPQVSPQTHTIHFSHSASMNTPVQHHQQHHHNHHHQQQHHRLRGDDVFAVPQMTFSQQQSQPSSKRPRSLWFN